MTKKRGRKPLPETERKDRVVQARVDEELGEALARAARRERVSVSQLIRNVLEDTFDLVDHVVADAVQLGQTVKRDARRIAESAQGQGRREPAQAAPPAPPREAAREPPDGPPAPTPRERREPAREPHRAAREPAGTARELQREAPRAVARPASGGYRRSSDEDFVYAWQEVVLARAAICARCGKQLTAGDEGLVGLTDGQGAPRIWLCRACGKKK